MTRSEFATIDLFAGLTDAGFELLETRGTEVVCPAGQPLVLHDAPAAGMYVLLEGTVNVELPGRSVELGPGQCVGELALLVPGSRRIARVRAVRDTRCLAVSRDVFEQLLDTEPSFGRALLRIVADRFAGSRQ